jgi:hypothetical protein
MKTIVVHIPKRCKKAKLEIFDAHIDLVNNERSKKYLPENTNILAMGMGGDNLISIYEEKYFGKKKVKSIPITAPKKVVKTKVVRKKQSVNKSELKRAINKQKKFLRGEVNKSF